MQPCDRISRNDTKLYVRRAFVTIVRFSSGSEVIHRAWPNLWDAIVSACAMKTSCRMNCKVFYYTRDTRVRWPRLKDVKVTPTDTDAPVLLISPRSLAVCTGCARDNWDSAPMYEYHALITDARDTLTPE